MLLICPNLSGVKVVALLVTDPSDGEGIALFISMLNAFCSKESRFGRTETGYPSVKMQARKIIYKIMGFLIFKCESKEKIT